MWYGAELVFCAWLLASGWWLHRLGTVRCLHVLAGAMLANLAGLGCGWAMDGGFRLLEPNLWLRLLAGVAVGTIAFSFVLWRWKGDGLARRARWTAWLGGGAWSRLLLHAMIATWLIGHVLIWTVVVNLMATADPQVASSALRHSLVTKYLIGSRLDVAALEGQQRALRGFRGGLTNGVDRLLDASGAGRVMEVMDALIWIAGLEPAQHERLINEVPELRRLADDPALHAVVEDPRLMRLVAEASEGSLSAVYALGGEPAIVALVQAPAMIAALATVDPVTIRRQFNGGPGQSDIQWKLSTLTTPLEFDARLASDEAWYTAPGQVLAWPTGQRYALARAQIAAVERPRRLQLTCDAELSCWVGDRLVRTTSRGGVREVEIPGATTVIVLLLDFGGVDGPQLCAARLLDRSPE